MGLTEETFRRLTASKEGQDELYRRMLPEVLPILERWIPPSLRPRWEPEDLFHEAFLKAVDRRESFQWRGGNSWRNYVLTVARNCVKDAVRRKSRLDVRFQHTSGGGGIEASAVPNGRPRPSEGIQNRDLLDEIFSRLKPSDREILQLRMLDELSEREVAARLGKSQEATRKALQRALERFARIGRKLEQPE